MAKTMSFVQMLGYGSSTQASVIFVESASRDYSANMFLKDFSQVHNQWFVHLFIILPKR